MRIFIFGAGYSARRFAILATRHGAAVTGTARSPERATELPAFGIEPLVYSGAPDREPVLRALAEATHLVVSAAPDERGDPGLRAFGDAIAGLPRLRWISYLSTVGVYGDHGGAWVDEESECRPVSRRSVARVAAERAWAETAARAGAPLAVLRLSGIYGPGRNAFVNLANGTAKRLIKKDQVFNRIHVDDIAGALWHLAHAQVGGVFNVTDDEPAPPQDVVTYAASLMGVEPPPEVPFDAAQLSPMARSFYGENKRVSNARLKASGYAFAHPDYRAALGAMWKDGGWAEGEPRRPMRA